MKSGKAAWSLGASKWPNVCGGLFAAVNASTFDRCRTGVFEGCGENTVQLASASTIFPYHQRLNRVVLIIQQLERTTVLEPL